MASVYVLKQTFRDTESGGEKPGGWSVMHKGKQIAWFSTKAQAEQLIKDRERDASNKLLDLLESLY